MINKDDYSDELKKRLNKIMPNEVVKAILKSDSKQDSHAPYLIKLRNSLQNLTNDLEFVNDLMLKFDNLYVTEGFVNDLIRRGRVGFDLNCYDNEQTKADETVEYYTSLRCDGIDAVNNRFKKLQFERGMSLAQQSEI